MYVNYVLKAVPDLVETQMIENRNDDIYKCQKHTLSKVKRS